MTLHDVEETDVVEMLAAIASRETAGGGGDATMLRELAGRARSEARDFMTLLANSVSVERGRSYLVWTVRNRRGDRPVGFVAFSEWSPDDACLDYACDAAAPAVAGVLRAVARWAFAVRPDLRAIRCECRVGDTHRAAALAAAGFTYRRVRIALHLESRAAPRPAAEWAVERGERDRGS